MLAKQSSAAIQKLFENIDKTSWAQWRVYISHAQFAFMDHDKACDKMIDLAEKCGNCLDYNERYREEVTMCQIILGHRKKVLGPENPDALTSISNLGLVLGS